MHPESQLLPVVECADCPFGGVAVVLASKRLRSELAGSAVGLRRWDPARKVTRLLAGSRHTQPGSHCAVSRTHPDLIMLGPDLPSGVSAHSDVQLGRRVKPDVVVPFRRSS